MFNRLVSIACLVVSIFIATGCAASASQTDLDRVMAENRRLTAENATLAGGSPVAAGPVGPMGAVGPVGAYPVPMGIPANVGFLNAPHPRCSRQLTLVVRNHEDRHFALVVDNEPATVGITRGGVFVPVPLQMLKPKDYISFCLTRQGIHTVRGAAYVMNGMGALQPDTSGRSEFRSEINVRDGYEFHITQVLMIFGNGNGALL